MTLTWYLANLVYGWVLAELPLAGTSVSRELSADSSSTWSFGPSDTRTPRAWDSLIEPGGVMIVAVLDGYPLHAWAITEKDVGSNSAPEIGGPSLEGLLERVYVRNYEAYGTDEALICAEIAEQVFSPGFDFTTLQLDSGTVRDVYYDGSSDLTVRALLDEYKASEPPIEFITDIAWAPGQEGARFKKTLRIGSALGEVREDVIFDSSCIASYKRKTSFASGFGATRLWGVGEGAGESRPMQGPFESSLLDLWGPWESRPAFTTATDEESLAARAQQEAVEVFQGTEVWEFVLNLNTAPMPGRDWDVGDTVTFKVDPSPNDPRGGTHVARVLKLDLDTAANTVTPTLAEKDRSGS